MTNPYVAPHLAEMPLPRVLVRSAECQLLSEVSFERPMLDIGSGDGHFAATLFPEPVDVGLDPDTTTMGEAVRRGGYHSLVVGSATDLPFRDGSLATVFSNSTLEHIPNLDDCVKEAARVLRPGGHLVVTFPSEHFGEYLLFPTIFRSIGLRGLSERYIRWFNGISRHYTVEGPQEWRRRFESVDLEVLSWRYYFTARNHKFFDLSHYLSVPSLLTHRILGRWVLFPGKARWGPLNRALEPLCVLGPEEQGAYLFFICRKPAA